jgi:GMP synthase-like glutamine amidotransferase
MARVLVVRHISSAGLGAYGDLLSERGVDAHVVDCEAGDEVPLDPSGYDGILSLGGPWSVHAPDRPAWVEPELLLLRRAAEAAVPIYGVCLGAQLLAAALGARVWTGEVPEVGIHPLRLEPEAAADPVFGGLPETLPMFHWHGDSFDLPEDAVLLARSDAYESQAFRWGSAAYGLQFHAESRLANVRAMIELPATRAQLDQAHGPGSADRILRDADTALAAINVTAARLFSAWLALAEEHAGAAPAPAAPTSG